MLYFLPIVFILPAFAQKNPADSLRGVLNHAPTDTARVISLYKLSMYYYLSRPDSGLYYASKALALSKKTGYKHGEMLALTQVGFSTWLLGNIPGGLQSFIASLNLAKSLNNKWGEARSYDGLSCVYGDENEFNSAISYGYKSKAIFQEIGDYSNVVDELMDISGYLYANNKADSALAVGKEALAISLKINDTFWRSQTLTSIGEAYILKGQNKLGLAYMYKSLAFATQYNQPFNLVNAYEPLVTAYRAMGNRDSCIYFAKKNYELSKLRSFAIHIVNSANALADVYFGVDDKQSAAYYKIARAVKDSLFNADKSKQFLVIQIADQQHAIELKNATIAYQNKIKFWAVVATLAAVITMLAVFWRNNKRQQVANKLLAQQKQQTETTLSELKTTQTQLIQSEKMASLGELTAGIAHEIQNPLNFVNNFSEVNQEMLQELKAESEKPKAERNAHLELELMNDLIENEKKISHHGKRADAIVKGMLEHSRSNSGQKEPTDINALADEYLRLAYHGLRAKDKNFNAELITHFDKNLPKVNVNPQDIGRVLLNLFNNAFYAVNQKMKTGAMYSFGASAEYKPTVTVITSFGAGQLVIKVKDNGIGMPDSIKEKIMQPFFTTKPTGEGTGLGLSLTYDMVVKGHAGSIKVDSVEGEGAEFIISLPLKVEL